MNLVDWKAGGELFEFGSHNIFFRQSRASKEVVLCMHGFPTASFDYHKIWDRMAEKTAVLTYDMIGYGFSAKPTDIDYTTFGQADILEALIAHLKIERVHILAHDYGDTVVQELLAREAENRLGFSIGSVCLMNGGLFPETHRPILAQRLLLGPAGGVFGRVIPDRFLKKSLASVFAANTQPTDGELNDFVTLFRHNGGSRVAHKLIRYMLERTRHRERWVSALQGIKQPFRLINGLEDPVSGRHLVARFREVVPHQTDIIELTGIGHFPHFEVPDAVIKAYFAFRKM